MMTHPTLTTITELLHQLRPDWDTAGILAHLETARLRVGVTPANLAIAAIRAATNPKNRTPAVIPLDGDHWREHVRLITTPQPPHRCRNCGNPITYEEPHTCIAPQIGDHRRGIAAVRAAYEATRTANP
jgi:hypothetical protein